MSFMPAILPAPVIVTTHTGEPVQPTRLQFRIIRRPKVERVLNGLHSIFRDADRPGTRLWHYAGEAQNVELPKRTHEIAKDLQPVILADISFPEPRQLVMKFRSPDRAIAAAKFFCPRFGDDAELERVRILNRLVTPAEADRGLADIDGLLDRDVTIIDPEVGLRELDAALATGRTRAEKVAAFERYHAEKRKHDVPEVEDFPLAMEEETPTFAHLTNTLRFRSLRAFEHWKGRKITLAQLIEEILARARLMASA